ncbi:hypothetical protein FQA39_LY12615 [Lamprigera yunnana]|nr:hypothetical protein FQA39_LY12615 [Lamprigera yunnana]
MFNTKLEIDKHVESCLKKINNENERNLRCLAFARLYFKVGEYKLAQRYVSDYLLAKPLSAEALSFLGKTLEKQDKREAAIDAYRHSLDINPKQNSLVLKICELLSLSDNITIDTYTVRHFCDKAQRIDPHNIIVYNLKERLVSIESQDPNDVTKLLLTELETRSTDVHLRVRLLRHLLLNNQIAEAYKHASDIEWKSLPIFLNSLSWYQIVSEVLMRYQSENVTNSSLPWEFWMLIVTVLDKLAALILNEHFNNIKSSSECIAAVFKLDQTLTVAAANVSSCTECPLVQEFLSHYRAQLCFHFCTLLFKQAKYDLIKYKDALNASLPLLFIAYHTQPIELHCLWLDHSPETYRSQAQKWHREASYRCSQAGHILLAAAKDRKLSIIEKAKQNSLGLWRQQIFKKLFITRDEQSKLKFSYFVTCEELINITFQLPNIADLSTYNEYAQLMYPDSLHNLVWICLNQKLSTFKCTVFEGLQYSTKNLNNCSAESLNILDIESFIYLTTLSAQAQEEWKTHYNGDKPPVIPASVTDNLVSLNQEKWLKATYKIYNNECGANASEVRLNLIRGIEVVRCVGNHGLDVKLLVTLANTFMARAKKLTKQSEIEFNEARADLYWKAALPFLEKLQKNEYVVYGPNRLFDYRSKDLSLAEISGYIDEARLFNGIQFMKRKEFEKALHIFDILKNPYASYHQAQIYKTMAEEQLNLNKESVTSEMRSQHIILLSRSRDCFYLTLDRLRDPLVDRKHPLNKQLGTEIEKIERLLSRIDSDMRNELDGLSDENVSSAGSMGDHTNNFYSSVPYHNDSLTPHLDRTSYSNRYKLELPTRREARPSPERLDAQLRQLQASRDASLGHIMEQNRMVIDSHRNLIEEIRWLKEAKSSEKEEMQSIKESIAEVKSIVEEFQNFRDITDLVHEMKKEIAELKKDQTKSKNQLSEEDLYVLDDEYGTDYGINSNTSGFNPNNLYQNYQGRLPPNYPAAAALYSGMYPVYPYHNLGLPQPGTLPFGQDSQIPDFRALNLTQPKFTWEAPQPNLGQLNMLQPVMTQPIQPIVSQHSNIFRETTSSSTSNVFSTPAASTSNSEAPNNVVITLSDPLPKTTVTTTQVLSVTIPPQHLKGNILPKTTQPHNYQIPLPATSSSILNLTPTVINQPSPVVTTQGLLSNVAPPIYSAIDNKCTSEKSRNQSFNTSGDRSLEEHDPCPDFKPIVPLPDEVPVTTGEENEKVLFSEKAKLFRYTNKEWKERGVGVLKILEDTDSSKIRLVMRRDQVHKTCANHFLTKDMTLTTMSNNNKAFIWAANDYADHEIVMETFCVRFKTEEQANAFSCAFQNAKDKLLNSCAPAIGIKEVDKNVKVETKCNDTSFGGFTFTSTPTFKPKDDSTPKATTPTETPKVSPFASFTFSFKAATGGTKLFSSTSVNEKPVQEENKDAPPVELLPDIKIDEEHSEILFECHAKLLRYDQISKDWKECGVGIMKILKEYIIRLVMRRDHVSKICFYQQLLKNTQFTKVAKNPKAFNWTAENYSEKTPQRETFTIRFKSEDQAEAFYKAVTAAQELLDEDNKVKSEENVAILEIKDNSESESKSKEDKKVKADTVETIKSPWSDKIKPSWKCKICFCPNEGKHNLCVGCEAPKNNITPKKGVETVFSFGISPPVSSNDSINKSQFSFGTPVSTTASTSFVFAQKPVSWGDTFKDKEGTWECSACYCKNDANMTKCISCQQSKDHEEKKTEVIEVSTSSWGNQFKPKMGSWECKQCLVRNDADKVYCVSCEHPKDDSVPKKESKSESIGSQFKFGMPTATTTTTTGFTFMSQPATSFLFGKQEVPQVADSKFSFPSADTSDKFVFGSPQQHSFEFTPRSPRRHSSGCQGGEEESDSFVEDDADQIYFKPLIPLPDKIDVKTGEEAEHVLYSHRAKLFRFLDGEWKERGIGDIKILLNIATTKLRVLMRREQVLKICLNHMLTSNIEYIAKDEKTWLFTAPDFSEGEINHWQFCVRFKTNEVAKEFKQAIDDALNNTKPLSDDKLESDTDTSEVEFISETQVTPEEEAEAIRLQLPPKFMAYRQLPDCTCELCKKEDPIYKDQLNSNDKGKNGFDAGEKFVFKLPPPDTFKSPTISKPNSFVTTESNSFKNFSFSLPTVTATTTSSIFTTPTKPIFENINFESPPLSGGSIFSDPKEKTIFKTPKNIFGNSTATFNQQNIPTIADKVETRKDDELIFKTDPNLTFASLSNSGQNFMALRKPFESSIDILFY